MNRLIDRLERRCPKLGSDITFKYCCDCSENNLPCVKVFDCWWETFDVVAYFRNRLSKSAFERLTTEKPKPKMVSLLELVAQARQNTGNE